MNMDALKLIHTRKNPASSIPAGSRQQFILSDGQSSYSVFETQSGAYECFEDTEAGSQQVQDNDLKNTLVSWVQENRQS